MSWNPHVQGHGSDRYFAELIQALHGAGAKVHACVVGEGHETPSAAPAIRVVASSDASLRRRQKCFGEQVEAVQRQAGSVLAVSHFAPYACPSWRLGRSIPHVVHFHGPWAAESAAEGAAWWKVALKRRLERKAYRPAQRLITLSNAFKQILLRDYGVAADRVRVVPGGIDASRYAVAETRTEARQKLKWPVDRPIVLTVRRLSRRMGLDRLVEAVSLLRQQVPDVLVYIGGKGEQADALARQIDAANLADNVRMIGFVPEADLALAYRAADVSVVPTRALEGFGLVCLESLASGTPVLVTPVGGLPEVVTGLDPKLVMNSGEPADIANALADALLRLENLPSADACQSYARENFDWSVIAPRVMAVYAEAIDEHARRRVT